MKKTTVTASPPAVALTRPSVPPLPASSAGRGAMRGLGDLRVRLVKGSSRRAQAAAIWLIPQAPRPASPRDDAGRGEGRLGSYTVAKKGAQGFDIARDETENVAAFSQGANPRGGPRAERAVAPRIFARGAGGRSRQPDPLTS